MEEVILIGDSIRMGYQSFVQKELQGWAQVWGPEENGGTSENVLNHLEEWVLLRRAGIIHVNAGLHDLRRALDATENAIPLEEYRHHVELVLRTVRDETGARLIWATTTPVNSELHRGSKGFQRLETNVAAYNEAATEICDRLGVEINDLFEVVSESGRDRLLTADGVHFTDEGYALLGKAVAGFIRGR